jgi:CHAD domain-containing protein
MAYLIHSNEPAADAVRRVLREQNQRAHLLLQGWEQDPVTHIHQTRQACKKIRALLRLVRPAARYVFTVENLFYRDIQRSVAYARDSAAMVEAVDLLASRLTDPLPLQSLRMLRHALEQRSEQQLASAQQGLPARIERAVAELAAADRRLQRLPVDGLRKRDLRRGASQTLDRCAREYLALDAAATADDFHDWRKHVKYAGYQARLLRELLPDAAPALRPRLEELAQALGQGQDLVLLEHFLADQPDALGVDTHLRRLRGLLATAQGELRTRARELGAALFAPAPAPRPELSDRQSGPPPGVIALS